MSDFYGLPTGVLENKYIRLEYLTSSGPRIVRFSPTGKKNLFAELPGFILQTALGPFSFYGGHRLWCSPEIMPETYCPDDDGLIVGKMENGVTLLQRTKVGIDKSIEIRLSLDHAVVTLTHRITNTGLKAVNLAPWALTMFQLGGVVILPQPVGNVDPDGLFPNRTMAVWPYTRINDPRLVLRDDYLLLTARPDLPPVKIGYYNPSGWMAYWLDGTLFRKSSDVRLGEKYPDGGCNAEVFCSDKFVELESLGPQTIIEPGSGVTLIEKWEIFSTLTVDFIPPQIQELIQEKIR